MQDVKEAIRGDGFFDQVLGVHLVSVMAGNCVWTKLSDIAFSTTLGSCLSVCAYDLDAKIGGMNHFLLPEAPKTEKEEFSTSFRYGSAAIESLLNALYTHGAAKNGIRIKVFGGGKVISGVSRNIGKDNVKFAKRFFLREHLRIESEDVGGEYGRRVIFFPRTGKVLLRPIGEDKRIQEIAEKEANIYKKISTKESVGHDVELF